MTRKQPGDYTLKLTTSGGTSEQSGNMTPDQYGAISAILAGTIKVPLVIDMTGKDFNNPGDILAAIEAAGIKVKP